jgi:hypothetical protein
MKYLFAVVFGTIAIVLSLMLGWTVFLAFTDSWQWLLVSLGILGSNVVSVLITSAALSAAEEY